MQKVKQRFLCMRKLSCRVQADDTNAEAFAVRGRALFFTGDVDQVPLFTQFRADSGDRLE
jgi:hypothetical protein